MSPATGGAAVVLAAIVAIGLVGTNDDPPPSQPPTEVAELAPGPPARSAPAPTSVPEPATAGVPPKQPPVELLRAGSGGDGDSWHDTAGREYRLGLVNTPETNECFGPEATRKRKELTAAGFTADVYTTDAYRRSVAVVTLADGTNLNVWLARNGFANDKYLEQFRSENAVLGAELDSAFAKAKAARVGLWGACSPAAPRGIAQLPPAPPVPAELAAGDCHPDYSTCIPIKGNGSGRGAANDLDCGEIGRAVELRRVGLDPYRLDREGDGRGCELP